MSEEIERFSDTDCDSEISNDDYEGYYCNDENFDDEYCKKIVNITESYTVISIEEIERLIKPSVAVVSEILKLPETITQTLLKRFQGQKEVLLEKYTEFEDVTKFLESLNIISNNKEEFASDEILECKKCRISHSKSEICELNCGHKFCEKCLLKYLEFPLSNVQSSLITCPENSCQILVDSKIINYVSAFSNTPKKLLDNYKKYLAYEFIENDKSIKWCPSQNCTSAVKLLNKNFNSVICDCGHRFCFNCKENPHDPISCKLLNSWFSIICYWEAVESFEKHPKRCEKCNTVIEKFGGSNIVRCIRCQIDLCWHCGYMWQNEHLCSSINYRNRYKVHEKSLNREFKAFRKANYLKEYKSFNELLVSVVQILFDCRMTIMNILVLEYFLRNRDSYYISLKEQRETLEVATENLSKCLGHDLEMIEKCAFYEVVMYRYCELLCQCLKSFVKQGFENGYLKTSED